MRDQDDRPQLSIEDVEDVEPPPDCDSCAATRDAPPEERGVVVIWPPADDE